MNVDADVHAAIPAPPVAVTAFQNVSSVVTWMLRSPDSTCSGRNTDHASERTYTYSPEPQIEDAQATPAMEYAQVLPIQFHFHQYLMSVL